MLMPYQVIIRCKIGAVAAYKKNKNRLKPFLPYSFFIPSNWCKAETQSQTVCRTIKGDAEPHQHVIKDAIWDFCVSNVSNIAPSLRNVIHGYSGFHLFVPL